MTEYTINDVVYYNGSSYISLEGTNQDNTPGVVGGDTTWWVLMSKAGTSGTSGVSGSNGTSGTATINNNTNDYVITATGTAGVLNGESNLRFDGTTLSVTGSARATAFYQDSSRVLKTNITPYAGSAIDLLNNVQVVEFNYLTDLNNIHIGFIAEDTPQELSTKDKNTMDTNSTVGVLIKAVQELSAEVKKLKGE